MSKPSTTEIDLFIFEDEEINHNFDYRDSPDIFLDENGFPSQQFLEDDINSCYLEEEKEVRESINTITEPRLKEIKEEPSFASEFYSAGSDWSCLFPEKNDDDDDTIYKIDEPSSAAKNPVTISVEKKLKQTDLFQVWGLGKKNSKVQGETTASYSFSPEKKTSVKMASSSVALVTSSKSVSTTARKRMRGFPDNRPRSCPFYKKMPGTPFTVDAFRYGAVPGCLAYFLTHFHADHYGGLSKGWSHGPIYCSSLTARLVKMCLYVVPSFIHPLEFNTEYVIERIKVTLLDANHCPGAALIHFTLPNGQCYLHTGDFRACKGMQLYPHLVNQRVNVLYLDTTYCNPKYKFPLKEDVLSYVVKTTTNFLKKQRKTLVVVGAYSIGKECVYLAIAKALGVKIFANASRRRVLQSFGWSDISESLTTDGKATFLHVLPMSSLRFESLKDYLKTYINQYSAVLAFRPTGWTYSETIGNQLDLIKPTSRGNITIYGVPYSEHSSFTELQEFVQFLRPEKIIPTVNVGSAASREKMESCFKDWLRR